MGHVPNANKKIKSGRIMGVTIVVILIVGCVTGVAAKRKPIQTTGIRLGKQTVSSVFAIEEEKQYIEFEKLFREQQDDIKKLAGELLGQDILDQKTYVLVFDEKWYLSMHSGSSLKDSFKFLYSNDTFKAEGNEEIIETLNEDVALKEALNAIIERGVINKISACVTGNIWKIDFTVDTKFTPFITGNNGVLNAFVYCEDEECEKYGNRKIEDNWYLWISPAPE